MTCHQFGRRSEQLAADQLRLAFEELEQTIADNQAGQDAAAAAAGLTRKPHAGAPKPNHDVLPGHLPRHEVVIDLEDRACPCCEHALHAIGELRTEQLDVVPSQLWVLVTRRLRYACHGCKNAVVIAPAPDRPVAGGMPIEALIAHVVSTLPSPPHTSNARESITLRVVVPPKNTSLLTSTQHSFSRDH